MRAKGHQSSTVLLIFYIYVSAYTYIVSDKENLA